MFELAMSASTALQTSINPTLMLVTKHYFLIPAKSKMKA
ncbi:hypothetical protein PPRY_a2443 [Pseudoalteromonas prydzensis ACAM 620]|nr:hypothetical protein [Pseudoalteromonas prydzensis ACAM 620]